jgi:hypothetical protein
MRVGWEGARGSLALVKLIYALHFGGRTLCPTERYGFVPEGRIVPKICRMFLKSDPTSFAIRDTLWRFLFVPILVPGANPPGVYELAASNCEYKIIISQMDPTTEICKDSSRVPYFKFSASK